MADIYEESYHDYEERLMEEEESFACLDCFRVSPISECNNLQCPYCGGNMIEMPDADDVTEAQ